MIAEGNSVEVEIQLEEDMTSSESCRYQECTLKKKFVTLLNL